MAKKTLEEIFGVNPAGSATSVSGLPSPQEIQQSPREGAFLERTVSNIPSSGKKFVGDIFNAVTNPIETVKSLGKVALGGVQKAVPGEQKSEEDFENVVRFFQERYGGKDAIIKTIEEDPVGFVADLAGLFTGTGAVAKGAGLTKASQTLSRAASAIEPLGVATKATGAVARPIAKGAGLFGREALGITTGAGGEVIESAFKAAAGTSRPEFKAALRGTITQDNILTSTREALNTLKDQRSATYQSQLKKIKGLDKKLDFSAVNNAVDDALAKWNIKLGKGGKLDFSGSKIADAGEQKRIATVIREVKNWKDKTPLGLDTLKQRLDDFYTPSGQGLALTQSIRNSVKNTLVKNVKGYAEMTSEYSKASDMIDEIQRTLSLTGKATPDATIKKLISAIKTDVGFKKALVQKLDDLTDADVGAQLAGTSLSQQVPSGLIGRSIIAGAGAKALGFLGGSGGLGWLIPLAGSSPRLVGEFLNALGFGVQKTNQVINALKDKGLFDPSVRVGATQAGRLDRETQAKRKTLQEIFSP